MAKIDYILPLSMTYIIILSIAIFAFANILSLETFIGICCFIFLFLFSFWPYEKKLENIKHKKIVFPVFKNILIREKQIYFLKFSGFLMITLLYIYFLFTLFGVYFFSIKFFGINFIATNFSGIQIAFQAFFIFLVLWILPGRRLLGNLRGKKTQKRIREISFEKSFTLPVLSDELIAKEALKYKKLSEPFKLLLDTSLKKQLPQSQIYATLSYRNFVVLQAVFVQRKFSKLPLTSFEMLEKIALTAFDWYIHKSNQSKPGFVSRDDTFWVKEHLTLFHQKFATVALKQNDKIDDLKQIANLTNELLKQEISDETSEKLVRSRLNDGIIQESDGCFEFVSPMLFDYFLVAEILRLLSQKNKVSLTGIFSRLNRSKKHENTVKLVDEVIPMQPRVSQKIYFELNSARIKNPGF